MIEALLDVQRRAQAAGQGGMGGIYADACEHLGLSHATLMRRLKEVAVKPPRKRRSDAGSTSLSLADAQQLSAVLMEGYRANNKSIQALNLALVRLRANRPEFAEATDPGSGEIRPLSESACARALRQYGLHPEQLRRGEAAQAQRSEHPNDVWQIDASISTLFYVPEGGVADMHPAVFYKNKPDNFEKIKRQRLTRYVITDHCSGAIFVHYVAGGESTVNMAEAFLAAIQPRPQQQMHGVPFHLMMDPGSAGTAGAFGNLLRRLQVKPLVNKQGNARAKGQVENAHNLVETNFESGFKFTHAPSIDWINAQAARWMQSYNSTRIHGRHGLSRWAKWMEITASQLRLVDPALARQLLTHEPETPKVDQFLRVRFAGRRWSVREVPGVMVGEKLAVTFNPFNTATAYVVDHDADGGELLIEVPEVALDEHGFAEGAALIGREFKSQPDTLADTNRKLVERLATGAATDAAAEEARKAKAVPFGGQLDPYKHHDALPGATMLPRRGTQLETGASVAKAAARVLTLFEVAAELARRGEAMTAERNAQVRAWYPEGVPEDQIDELKARLAARESARAGLRVVGGAQ
jgi:transposase InsO family protein